MAEGRFEVVVIGSGFGSLFFLRKYLEKKPSAKVAVIEWGTRRDYAWQLSQGRNSELFANLPHQQKAWEKPWNYTIGFGGGTNCWWGQALRLVPEDFEMLSRYGVLSDWPFSYDELEPYYLEAEQIMSLSGSDRIAIVAPRSGPFPLPPHRVSAVDSLMLKAQPELHFPIPTARASVSLASRNRCCASARCHLCPVDAKFTAFNGLADVIDHPAITWFLQKQAWQILHAEGLAQGVLLRSGQEEQKVFGDLIVLGANAIQSPAILLRSGLDHPYTGVGLTEQHGYEFEVLLDGLDNFGGGTATTGLNYSLNSGPHRREAGAALLFFENRIKHGLRKEYGRWRQTLPLIVNVEDLPETSKTVTLTEEGEAFVSHPQVSAYAKAGLRRVEANLEKVLSPLPVEAVVARGERPTESHLQCSLRAGRDPRASVVDGDCLHHRIRNLVVVGSAVFPTCPPANPSLTVAALSLRAADRLMR